MFRFIGRARRSPGASPDDRSNRAERILIGGIGAALPPLVYFLSVGLPPHHVADRWSRLPSISSYYYTAGVAAFVGMLVTLALFLFAYQGYANRTWGRLDRIAARVAGTAAIGVAFFPTTLPGHTHYLAEPWWRQWMCYVHVGSAAVLFLSFAFFALVLFPRTGHSPPDAAKRRRDWFYRGCGVGILAALLWALLMFLTSHGHEADIFWPETFALEFFAMSWLVKGRAPALISRQVKHVFAGPPPDLRGPAGPPRPAV